MATSSPGWVRLPVLCIGTISCVSLLLMSVGGADYHRYEVWASALRTGDVTLLRSPVGSPLGIPLSQWSHGPGLIWGFGELMLGPVVDTGDAAMAVGWLGAPVFWWASFRLLTVAAHGRSHLVWLGAGALLVGTHAGFHSHVHASESVALVLVSLLMLVAVERWKATPAHCLFVGSVTALLLITRSYLGFYALPAIVLLFRGLVWSSDGLRPRVVALGALVCPLALGLAQLAFVNRWMTGSVARSAYLYGDDRFSSVDWLHPEFWAVLTHPWHGLLVYHPLYAVGFLALLVLLSTSTDRAIRWLCGLAVAALFVNLYAQASWVAWWMGPDSLGMRGLAVSGVVLVPALIRVVADAERQHSRLVLLWVSLTVVCCLWSFLLLIQGPTQFYEYAQVLEGQRDGLARVMAPRTLRAILLGGLFTAFLVLSLRVAERRATHRRLTIELATLMLGSMSLGYLLRPLSPWPSVGAPVLAAMLLLISMWSLRLLADQSGRWLLGRAGGDVDSEPMIRWGTVAVFVVGTVLFGNLAARTEAGLAAGLFPRRAFQYTSDFYMPSAVLAYRAYTRLDGFDERREEMRAFLIRQGLDP